MLKAAAQKFISLLPFTQQTNQLLQKYVTKRTSITDVFFTDKLIHVQKHLQYFFKYSNLKNEFTTLELGTGRYPIIPICMYLSGANKIYSVDINDMTSADKIKQTIIRINKSYEDGVLQQYITVDKSRLTKLNDLLVIDNEQQFNDAFHSLGFLFLLEDINKSKIEMHSIDLLHSNNTFEHIAPNDLKHMMTTFKLLLKPSGLMSHFIDMTDHFSHFDKSISVFNYLKYSPKKWQLIDNNILPQNRLRITDFRNLFEQNNFEVLIEENNNGPIAELQAMHIDTAFKHYTEKDLLVCHSYMVVRQKN